MRPPLSWEIDLMDACLRVLPDFVARGAPDDPTRELVPASAGSASSDDRSWASPGSQEPIPDDADRSDRAEGRPPPPGPDLPDQLEHQGPHRPHPGPGRRPTGGIEGWGESASPSDPYYCPETTETCWHILKDFLAPEVLGRDWETIDELIAPVRPDQGEPLRQGRARDGLLGRPGEPRGASRSRAARRDPGRDRLGRQPGDRARPRRAARPGRPLRRRGLPADQAQDRPGVGRRGRSGRSATRHPGRAAPG